MRDEIQIIFTKKCEKLAWTIATHLSISAFQDSVRIFKNAEISVSIPRICRESIVIASTITNNDWIELFLLLNAVRHSQRIILCMPFMGYARQDLILPNESCGAQVFACLLDSTKISQCITLEQHSVPMTRTPTIDVCVDDLFISDIMDKFSTSQIAIVSPDLGGAARASRIAKKLNADFAVCRKVKTVFGDMKQVDVIGDVRGKICIIVDDIIDSGATMFHAAEALTSAGAAAIVAYAVHGLFSGNAVEKLEGSVIKEIVLTDSVSSSYKLPKKFRELSVDSLLIETIREIL